MPTPSLIIPSAPVYDEGLLYGLNVYGTNFVPEPIPFTRATTATRTNAAGLIELAPYNLVQYSEQFDNAVWDKNNTTVTANSTISPSGIQDADTIQRDGVLSSLTLAQDISVTSGVTYTLSIYAKKNTNNFIQITGRSTSFALTSFANFDLNNGVVGTVGATATATITNVGNGWYRCTATMSATGTASVDSMMVHLITSASAVRLESNTLSTSVFLWGAQLVEGTAALPYLKTETRLNRPRVDYSLGGCPNILLEPQRTNLALQSSSFDSASWTKITTAITPNSTTSPSGIVDADTYTGNGASSQKFLFQTASTTSGTTYTLSVYAKKNTNNFLQIAGESATFGTNVWANFNLDTGVVGTVGSLTTARIENVGNGWYRCSITGTATATTTAAAFVMLLVNSATSIRYETNTLNTSVFLWGAQLEAGAYPTTYIPTTTTSVTRNADSFVESNVFSRGMITAAGGAWFFELRNNLSLTRDAAGSNGMYLSSGNGFNNDGFLIWNWNTTTPLQITKYVSNAFIILHTLPVGTCKVAIKWNGSTADIFVNGVKVIASTVFTGTTMQNLFGTGASIPFNIQQMALYPTPLTDDELITMTTI